MQDGVKHAHPARAAEQPSQRSLQVHRRLDRQSKAGYDKGRSVLWQAAWFAASNLIFQAWWLPIRFRPFILRAFGGEIGHGVYIRHGVRILWPWKLSIGDHSQIGDSAWIINLEPVRVGKNVAISQGAVLCAGGHDPRSETFAYDNGSIVVEDGAWITIRAVVLRGVVVPAGSLVPAGAVVRRGHFPSAANGSNLVQPSACEDSR